MNVDKLIEKFNIALAKEKPDTEFTALCTPANIQKLIGCIRKLEKAHDAAVSDLSNQFGSEEDAEEAIARHECIFLAAMS
ncbi:hypothetical protein [Photorhabdus caribbeanensis]|uniref:hypothetical protein n=1 Tax=Photorhabdus caribbeanensis TaxID=1004165 RepID=UPI001BD28FE1|nr:hypothetical protein [Photorhabdus caribbeanensis]MBS9422246.1 hypothetical protein [Photorhabdus caribbeanensis]